MPVTIASHGSGGRQSVDRSQLHNARDKMTHIVFVSSHFRSHFRPLFFTALSLATRYTNLVITVYVTEGLLSIVDEEFELFFGDSGHRKHPTQKGMASNGKNGETSLASSESVSDRVRVVGLPRNLDEDSAPDWQQEFKSVYDHLPGYLKCYWTSSTKGAEKETINGMPSLGNGNGNSSSSKVTNGHSHSAVFETSPTTLVFDILIDISKVVQSIQADLRQAFPGIKLIGWAQNPVAWALRLVEIAVKAKELGLTPLCFSSSRLTAPDIQHKLKLLDCDLDEDGEPSEAANKHIEDVLMRTDGSIIEVQGSHRCYDYELIPQYGSMEFNARNMHIVYKAGRNLRRCDGVLFSNCPELEPDAAAILQKELGRPVFQIGAQLPPRWKPLPSETLLDGNDETSPEYPVSKSGFQIRDFLDNIYRKLGPKRVLYISFGSVYSMEKRPDLITTLIQALIEVNSGPNGLQIPFIFTTFTTKDLIPQELHRQIEQAGIGIFCKFAPQHLILRHPATAWFLTHGGSNSVHESIYNAVPLVFWPATTDQPIGASQICLTLDCGVELIQVRTGPSVGRPTMRGVQHHGGSLDFIKTEIVVMLELIVSQHKEGDYDDQVKRRSLQIRANVEQLAIQMRKSQDSGGSCWLAVEELYKQL